MNRVSFLFLLFIFSFSASLHAGEPLKVMTWNIRYDNPDDGPNAWNNRKEAVITLIKAQNADIYCFQEVLHSQYLSLQYMLNYGSYGVGRDDGKEAGEYAPVFYNKQRFQLVKQGRFWLSEDTAKAQKGWDAACVRIATWVKLLDIQTRDTVLVINTHFDHVGTTARLKSAKLLVEFVLLNAVRNPLIIAGDFNCRYDSPPMMLLQKHTNTQRAKSDPPDPQQPAFTYCGFDGKGTDGDIIDHIFFRRFSKIKSFRILTDHQGTTYPSDHFPVITELSY